jgi:hypothetical protein
MFNIPQDKRWTQPNNSDVFGALWSSFNLDLTSVLGKLRISPRFIRATHTGDFSKPVVAVENINDLNLFVGPSNFVWNAVSTDLELTGTIASDTASSGHPTGLDADYSDAAAFNNAVYISNNTTTLHKTANGTSYAPISATSTTGNKPKMLCPYGARLYSSQDAKMFSLDTSDVVQTDTTQDYAINLNSTGAVITRPRPTTTGIWIPTVNTFGGPGHVFFWNGVDHSVAQDFILESSGALALVIKDDVPWILDTEGRLLQFNGGSFVERARLPIERKYLYNATSPINDRFIHPNGMTIDNGRIQILVDTRYAANGNPQEERAPAGIWEFDENIGFYHKASLSYYKYASGAIGDYGQQRLTRVGLLKHVSSASAAVGDKGNTFASAAYNNGNMVASAAELWFDETTDAVQKHGHFVTQWLTSGGITDFWQDVVVRFRKMLSATDKITVKYRTSEDAPVYATFTWDNTHQLTTVTNVAAYVGAEIEFIAGSAAGMCAHISAVSGAGPYTITLDQDMTLNTTDYIQPTSYAKIQTWKNVSSFNEVTQQFKSLALGVMDTKIQLKVCFTATGRNEIDDVLLINAPQKRT